MSILILQHDLGVQHPHDVALGNVLVVLLGGAGRSHEPVSNLVLSIFVAAKRLKSDLIRQRFLKVFQRIALVTLWAAFEIAHPISAFSR